MNTTRMAALAGGALALCAVAAGGASGAVTIGGWGTITADMGGGALVWADAQPARTRTFTYWRDRSAAGD